MVRANRKGGYSKWYRKDGGYIIAGFTNSFGVGDRDIYLIYYNPENLNKSEIMGTWNIGFWYFDVAASSWTKLHSGVPSGDVAEG